MIKISQTSLYNISNNNTSLYYIFVEHFYSFNHPLAGNLLVNFFQSRRSPRPLHNFQRAKGVFHLIQPVVEAVEGLVGLVG